jgi:hypothetical protein
MAMRKAWTVANWVMAVVFGLSLAVQINDPDPLRWILLYAAAAAVCVLEARRRTPWPVAAGVALIALLSAAWIGRDARFVPIRSLFAEWEMRDTAVEEEREIGGLLIVMVWTTAVAIVARRGVRGRAGSLAGSEPDTSVHKPSVTTANQEGRES